VITMRGPTLTQRVSICDGSNENSNETSLPTATSVSRASSMRVEREPSCSAEKNSGATARCSAIHGSAPASVRLKCNQMKSLRLTAAGSASHSRAPVQSIGTPASPPANRKPQIRPLRSEPQVMSMKVEPPFRADR